MPKIKIEPGNIEIDVSKNENLLRAVLATDAEVSSACGGAGTCKRCKAKLIKGKVDKGSTSDLNSKEVKDGFFLLCLAKAVGDCEIEIPLESARAALKKRAVDKKILDEQLKSAHSFEDRLPTVELNPLISEKMLKLEEPTIDDPRADLERIRATIHLEKNIPIELSSIQKLPSLLRDSNWQIKAGIINSDHLKGITYLKSQKSNFLGIAIDIGTTTMVAELINLESSKVLQRTSRYNAQISYGDDVISRIIFAGKKDGLVKLQKAIIETINDAIEELLQSQKMSKSDISLITAAGNTTMSHLFLGIQPTHIRQYPYVPAASYFPIVKASKLSINAPLAQVYTFPSMASYVGGDIIAGLLAIDIINKKDSVLFIDVGTNGEMVLGSSDWLLSCACSAGPAFEGGGVKDGMRATRGAIEMVRISQNTLKPTILTIDNQPPLGICGSGLIDAIAELYLSGIITPNGKFNNNLDPGLFRKINGTNGYLLCDAEQSGTGKDILLTETDIDNFIRAKGAVYSGVTTLLDSVGLSVTDINEVLIAGAFGNYLDIEKAIVIGLLPDLPKEKFSYVGNGSLLGARLGLLSKDMLKRAEEIASRLTYMDLSSTPKYMDMYMSALFLPHTDISLFPSVQKKAETINLQ